MRRINRSFDSPPKSLKDAWSEQELVANSGGSGAIKDSIFKGKKITITDSSDEYYNEEEYEIRYRLRVLFYNKCAYCECIEYKPDVEHYRPKGRVDGSDGNDFGYYWLCYEWTNLIPACSECNRPPGKHDKFPVTGIRVTRPPLRNNGHMYKSRCKADHPYLLAEGPTVLHPRIDNPETHLMLEWDGSMSPTGPNPERGRNTHLWSCPFGMIFHFSLRKYFLS